MSRRMFSQPKLMLTGVIVLTFLLTGCWDRIEIDQRVTPYTIGVDLPDVGGGGVHSTDSGSEPKMLVSLEVPILRALGSSKGAPGLLPELQKPATVLSESGGTFYAIQRMLAGRMSRTITWAHVKAVVIGEAFARDIGLGPSMDFLARQVEFDRRIRVGIAKGEARPILESVILAEEFVGPYLVDVMESAPKTGRVPIVTLNDVDAQMRNRGNILLPRFELVEQGVLAAGAAIIKQGKLVGWLDPLETQWALAVTNDIHEGWIVVPDPDDPQSEVIFNIMGFSSRIRRGPARDRLQIEVHVVMEGEIAERVAFNRMLDRQSIDRIERSVADAVEKGIQSVLKSFQETYRVDVFGFDDYLSKWHPSLWREVEADWDEVGFPNVEVMAHVVAAVRRYGTVL